MRAKFQLVSDENQYKLILLVSVCSWGDEQGFKGASNV
jgi:hypothetical protein